MRKDVCLFRFIKIFLMLFPLALSVCSSAKYGFYDSAPMIDFAEKSADLYLEFLALM